MTQMHVADAGAFGAGGDGVLLGERAGQDGAGGHGRDYRSHARRASMTGYPPPPSVYCFQEVTRQIPPKY